MTTTAYDDQLKDYPPESSEKEARPYTPPQQPAEQVRIISCNCSAGLAPWAQHALICQVRKSEARLLDPYDGGTWVPAPQASAHASATGRHDEVTPEMILAGARAAREYYERTGGNDLAVIYRAMHAAQVASQTRGS